MTSLKEAVESCSVMLEYHQGLECTLGKDSLWTQQWPSVTRERSQWLSIAHVHKQLLSAKSNSLDSRPTATFPMFHVILTWNCPSIFNRCPCCALQHNTYPYIQRQGKYLYHFELGWHLEVWRCWGDLQTPAQGKKKKWEGKQKTESTFKQLFDFQ